MKKGDKMTIQHKRNLSLAASKRWSDPEYRMKMKKSQQKYWSILENRVKRQKIHSELMKKYWADPEFKAKLIQAAIDSHKTKRHGFQKGHKNFSTPESRRKQSLALIKPRYTKVCPYCKKTLYVTATSNEFKQHTIQCKKVMKRKIKRQNNPNLGTFKKDAKHSAIHLWVFRKKGKASQHICVDCKIKQAEEWSNIDHKYRRVLDDYQPRCTMCHRRFDILHNNSQTGRSKKIK